MKNLTNSKATRATLALPEQKRVEKYARAFGLSTDAALALIINRYMDEDGDCIIAHQRAKVA